MAEFYLRSVLQSLLLLPLGAALLLAPAYLPARQICRSVGAPQAAAWPLAFALSIGTLSITTSMAWLLGAGLVGAGIGFLVVAVIASVLCWQRGRPTPAARPASASVYVVTGLFTTLSLLQGAWLAFDVDAFYHLAASRWLVLNNAALVTEPMFGLDHKGLGPAGGVWHSAMALLSTVTHIDVMFWWASLAALISGVTVLAIWSLTQLLCGSAAISTWTAVVFMVAIRYSDLRGMSYPEWVSFCLLFTTLWVLALVIETPRVGLWAAAVISGSGTLLTHTGTAVVLVLTGALMVLGATAWALSSERDQPRLGYRPVLASLSALVVMGLMAVPATLSRLADLRTAGEVRPVGFELERWFVQPVQGVLFGRPFWLASVWNDTHPRMVITVTLAIGALGLVVFYYLVRKALSERTGRSWSAVGIASLPLVICLPPLSLILERFSPYTLVRLGFSSTFASILGIAVLLAAPDDRHRVAMWVAAAELFLLVSVSLPGALSVYDSRVPPRFGSGVTVQQSWEQDRRRLWGYGTLALVNRLAQGSIPRIGSDPMTSYVLAGLTGVYVAAVPQTHSPGFVEEIDGAARRDAMNELVAPNTPTTRRLSIAARYGIDLVAVSDMTPRSAETIAQLDRDNAHFDPVVRTPRLSVYRVKRPR